TRAAQVIACSIDCYRADGKTLWCGNGGSAADAQHLAAELSGRYYFDRPPLYAEALHVNTSYLTAVSNDYGYAHSYTRLVQAAGRRGDILFALSTSGNSPNVLAAAKMARSQGMIVVALTGQSGGQLGILADYLLAVPSTDTPRIQEGHMLLGHIICEGIEQALFG
ncbi:MAG: SIS domain-containing protein, partial [Bacteroidetes bacterium]